jgi:hypothetical protein
MKGHKPPHALSSTINMAAAALGLAVGFPCRLVVATELGIASLLVSKYSQFTADAASLSYID